MVKAKNILITAGGTQVKIDDVRHISNFSSGRFLSQLAEEALLKGYNVFYLHAKRAKTPFADRFILNPLKSTQAQVRQILKNKRIFLAMRKKLSLYTFETVEDYARLLERALKTKKIDVVFLGAAVSDYGLRSHRGKISSSKEKLVLRLFKYPKLIKLVKMWTKNHIFQVGFKLLSNVAEKELLETAYRAGINNHSDLTIANDLVKIKSIKREVLLVTPEKGVNRITDPDLAKNVFAFVERRFNVTHFQTIIRKNNNLFKKYKKQINAIILCARQLSLHGLIKPFFINDSRYHGSLSLRINDKFFLITSRGSNKKHLSPNDIVLVKRIDYKKRQIMAESISGVKPSFNAILSAIIFQEFPKVNAMVHTHNSIAKRPTTSFPETPGTLEYCLESVKLLRKNRLINLKNHGLIAAGQSLAETVNYVIKKSKTQRH